MRRRMIRLPRQNVAVAVRRFPGSSEKTQAGAEVVQHAEIAGTDRLRVLIGGDGLIVLLQPLMGVTEVEQQLRVVRLFGPGP